MSARTCLSCRERKPLTAFTRRGRGHEARCSLCQDTKRRRERLEADERAAEAGAWWLRPVPQPVRTVAIGRPPAQAEVARVRCEGCGGVMDAVLVDLPAGCPYCGEVRLPQAQVVAEERRQLQVRLGLSSRAAGALIRDARGAAQAVGVRHA